MTIYPDGFVFTDDTHQVVPVKNVHLDPHGHFYLIGTITDRPRVDLMFRPSRLGTTPAHAAALAATEVKAEIARLDAQVAALTAKRADLACLLSTHLAPAEEPA